jgi:flavin reductase (DIM6/NTAB) family NADH-FMN oxidoreductase RutF
VSELDTQALRRALGRFATGVTIVTCRDAQQRPVGLTANSFSSLSLNPALVLWSLRRSSPSLAAFSAATHFAVNVLGEAQVDLSRRFASAVDERFSQGLWSSGLQDLPVLGGSAALFECASVSQQDAGDHVLFIGRVLNFVEAPVPPLLFQAGHYRMLGEVL